MSAMPIVSRVVRVGISSATTRDVGDAFGCTGDDGSSMTKRGDCASFAVCPQHHIAHAPAAARQTGTARSHTSFLETVGFKERPLMRLQRSLQHQV